MRYIRSGRWLAARVLCGGILGIGSLLHAASVRIACVGDSLTLGTGTEPSEPYAYPSRLQELLGDRAIIRNFGVGGRTLSSQTDRPYVRAIAWAEVRNFEPDVVLIMLDTNDTQSNYWPRVQARLRDDAVRRIRQFREMPRSPTVWWLLPPPIVRPAYGLDPTSLRFRVLPRLCEAAADARVPVVDTHTPFLEHPDRFLDGVHLDPSAYLAIAMLVSDALTGPGGPLHDSS